jgi:hypothetical protein
MSVLALDSRTRNLQVDFRSGANTGLDLFLDGTHLLINDKWFDFCASHQNSSCSLFLEAAAKQISIDRFSCTHVVKSLYDSVLLELSSRPNPQQQSRSDHYMRQLVSEKIDQMPCMLKVAQGEAGGVLDVSWVHPESERIFKLHHLELRGHVVLHRKSTCAALEAELLAFREF